MNEPRCHWDEAAGRHLLRSHLPACTDRDCRGCQPCLRDEHGNPVQHCRQRRRCNGHLEDGEHTCPACRLEIRRYLATVCDLQSLMLPAAMADGMESEAAVLAGPSANPVVAQWRLVNLARNGVDVEELDWRDPYTAITVRERMIREEYGHDLDTLVSSNLLAACGYIIDQLPRLSRDPGMVDVVADVMSTARDLVEHLESVLHNDRRPERGAHCPACPEDNPPALQKRYGWTEDADRWVCPRDRTHAWSEEQYRKWVAADYLAYADRLPLREMVERTNVPHGTLKRWASSAAGEAPLLRSCGRTFDGVKQYRVSDVEAIRDTTPALRRDA